MTVWSHGASSGGSDAVLSGEDGTLIPACLTRVCSVNSLTAIQTSTGWELTTRLEIGRSARLVYTLASNEEVVKQLYVVLGVLVWQISAP